ncbi:restriction endonuclease subunit S [Sulfitobacter sp. 916]|uniref:restriction endonuclease subunit S n=1 Tax=Sulfitobacter sp. 916 TaxID=3368559 RepID=UPI0037467139
MVDWNETTLGDFISLQRGHDLPTATREKGDIPVMGSFGITGSHSVARAKGPGVTVGRSGASIGVVSYVDVDYWPLNTCLFATDFHGNNPRFAYYFLQTLDLASHNSGSAQPSLNRNYISPIRISVPDRKTQDHIAGFLGGVDDKIELNRRMNETLEAMAQAIFRDWFVDFGPTRRKMEGATDPVTILGGLIPTPDKAAPLAAVFPATLGDEGLPEGWEGKPLDEIATFLNGLALQKYPADNPADSLPVIKIAELRNGVSAKSNRASRAVPDKYVIRDGDFLFSWSGSLMAKFWTEGEGALNQHLFKVSSDDYPTWFYTQWVHKHLAEFQQIAASKATTMGHIQRGHLKAAKTVCPSDDAWELMGEVMEPITQKTIQNDLENRTLAATRDLLLPKLMSGEIRLRDVEAVA